MVLYAKSIALFLTIPQKIPKPPSGSLEKDPDVLEIQFQRHRANKCGLSGQNPMPAIV